MAGPDLLAGRGCLITTKSCWVFKVSAGQLLSLERKMRERGEEQCVHPTVETRLSYSIAASDISQTRVVEAPELPGSGDPSVTSVRVKIARTDRIEVCKLEVI